MFKKILLLACVLMFTNAHAYKKGDTISPSIAKTLRINPSKVTIIDFFASWCVSCKKELPLMSKLNKRINRSKVEILGVCTDKSLKKGKAFQKKVGINFRVYNDTKQKVISAFNPVGMPATYIVKGGKVLGVLMGAMSKKDRIVEKFVARH
ncbi:MAG: TlpA family protein disulfide reductase [Sulfurovum sp.]|nr:TlpA family protein disulfide reductase [Sulfurovum sp.]